MTKNPLLTGYHPGASICTPCAEKNGCTWPEGHAATFNCEYPCDYCGKKIPFDEGGVCDASDWNWPGKNIAQGDLSTREL